MNEVWDFATVDSWNINSGHGIYIQKPKNQRRDADLNVKRAHVKQERLKNGRRIYWVVLNGRVFDPIIESYGDVTLDFRELWGLLRNSEIL
jgi:hypothetical protein